MANIHEKLNYVEYPARDITATKVFFEATFGWKFTDFGPDYTAFDQQGVEGGFYAADMASDSSAGAALMVFYSDALEETMAKITRHGGAITKEIFDFPGGRRFHFTCPSGNEFAVWSPA